MLAISPTELLIMIQAEEFFKLPLSEKEPYRRGLDVSIYTMYHICATNPSTSPGNQVSEWQLKFDGSLRTEVG
jgi:hypothetical protein